MGVTISRGLVLGFGFLLVVGGLAAIVAGPGFVVFGLITLACGAALMIAASIERLRYRSAHAEREAGAPGPGGGEPVDQPMEPRFRRTDERFVDPTSGHVMRVWLDPSTGERRYRAEG